MQYYHVKIYLILSHDVIKFHFWMYQNLFNHHLLKNIVIVSNSMLLQIMLKEMFIHTGVFLFWLGFVVIIIQGAGVGGES